MRHRTRIQLSLDHTLQENTSLKNEPILPIRQFGLFLKRHNLPGSLRTVYRWLTIPKAHLPQSIQDLIPHAPSMWFIEINQSNLKRDYTHGIPIRYFQESLRPEVSKYAINTVDSHLDKTIRTMRTALIQLHEDIDRLEHYLTATQGKESAHDGDRTNRHSLTA